MARIQCNFFSYSLGFPVDIQIILPSLSPCDMDSPQLLTHKLEAKYPVLYLLHGHGNDYLSWSRFTSMERYVEERRIAAVSCSVGNKAYMNAEYGERYFDFVAQELPEFVQANFPISARPEDTYLAGLSMGGYGTLCHGLSHPQSYRAIGAFSPVPVLTSEEGPTRLGHTLPPTLNPYELIQNNRAAGTAMPDLFLCIGQKDFLFQPVRAFHQYLLEQNIPHRYDENAAYEHEWGFWDLELPQFLDWLPRTDPYARMDLHKM